MSREQRAEMESQPSPLQRAGVPALRTAAIVLASVHLIADFPSQVPSIDQLVLLGALVVISMLDIGLSHGDTADVDTALLVAGVYLYGSSTVLVMCALSRILVHVVLSRTGSLTELVDALAKRFIAIVISTPLLSALTVVSTGTPIDPYVQVTALGIVFTIVQLVVGQVGRARNRSDSVLRLLVGNLALQGPLAAAGISVAVLLVVIVEGMGPWGIALTLVLLITMRQSFALLLEIRSSYQATIEALVGAMEVQRLDGRGAGERTAAFARAIAAELGWFGVRLERIGYAALLHFYGLGFSMPDGVADSDNVKPLVEVEFLRPVAPLLTPLEVDSPKGLAVRNLRSAYVVGRAVAEFSPDYSTTGLHRLEAELNPRWVARVERAIGHARRKT